MLYYSTHSVKNQDSQANCAVGNLAGRLSEKSYYIRLKELLNHKIIFAEHIVCVFPENIITRFDAAVNDVVEEFAKRLRINLILNLPKILKNFPIYSIMIVPSYN